MAGDGKPPPASRARKSTTARKRQPAAKAAPRKQASKRAVPAKSTPKQASRKQAATATDADRAKARSQIASVTTLDPAKRSKPTNPRHRPTHPDGMRLHQRRVTAAHLRRLGYTFEEVAVEIRKLTVSPTDHTPLAPPSYDRGDAHADVRAILDAVTVEAALELRTEDLATLLAMQRGVYADAVKGSPAAIRSMLAIMERRAKTVGYDSPVRHQLTGADGGPIVIDTTDPGAVLDAAMEAIGDLLPHVDPIELPRAPGG